MESRHQQHAELIAKMILNGRTHVAVVDALRATGCMTTTQGLGQWLRRRALRVAAAKTLWSASPAKEQSSGSDVLLAPMTPAASVRRGSKPKEATSQPASLAQSLTLPVIGSRSYAIGKQEPSDMEKKLTELAQQVKADSPLSWKK